MNKMPKFYMIFARKMPEIFGGKFFSQMLGGTCPRPPSPTPMTFLLLFTWPILPQLRQVRQDYQQVIFENY